jgi:hypothetical protein
MFGLLVFRQTFVLLMRDIPRLVVVRSFRAFEQLAITATLAAVVAGRTGNMFIVAAWF